MTKSKSPRRTVRTLDTAALANITGGADLYYNNIGGGLLGLYTGVNDGGLLGVKSLTSGVGGLIAT
jgi:hypothetical protein